MMMNAEPFFMSDSRARLGRVAISWRGDEAARLNANPETSRFKAAFAALAEVGIDAEAIVYEDAPPYCLQELLRNGEWRVQTATLILLCFFGASLRTSRT